MSQRMPYQYYQNEPHPSRPGSAQAAHVQHATNGSNYASRTTTIIDEQIRNRLPTLVLKLEQRAAHNRNSGKMQSYHKHPKLADLSDRELDEYLAYNLHEFKRDLMNNIDSFHKTLLSAKPNPAKQRDDPEGYRIHLEKYQEFLQIANQIMKNMQDSFNDILTRYREHVDNLWSAICQGQDVRQVQHHFQQYMQQNMARYWQPVFDRADRLIAEIDLNFHQYSAHPVHVIKITH
ncbi:unnamed protein product [Adineta ricciae]|uniref:Uncharacterized protein n=1 Tax=Adineta ricciae TaxID=249248 RepID=A0A815MA49_ADIRI|nr:unnamed protein product [Adineta ricciae]CAF1431424.1 unnamed protein product [Adineta ricciae]